MDKKLTLSLDSKIIERAKRYTKEHGRSLSELVENYFLLLTSDIDKGKTSMVMDESKGYSPIEKYKGTFRLPEDFGNSDYDKIISEERWKKYMK